MRIALGIEHYLHFAPRSVGIFESKLQKARPDEKAPEFFMTCEISRFPGPS